MSGERHVVAEVGEIPPGGHKVVTVARREIGVYFVDGEYLRCDTGARIRAGRCATGGCFVSVDSRLPGEYVYGPRRLLQCPWHGWEFDIRTGQSWFDPEGKRVRRYPVSIEEGKAVEDAGALQPGELRAETYPSVSSVVMWSSKSTTERVGLGAYRPGSTGEPAGIDARSVRTSCSQIGWRGPQGNVSCRRRYSRLEQADPRRPAGRRCWPRGVRTPAALRRASSGSVRSG